VIGQGSAWDRRPETARIGFADALLCCDGLSPTSETSPAPFGDLFPAPLTRRSTLVRASLGVGGTLLVIAGIALTILPVVPGFPLTIAGAIMLAGASRWIRDILNAIDRRLPRRVRSVLRRFLHRHRESGPRNR
jgi:hypothetical protein